MIEIFDELKEKFLEHGYKLYVVGGTSRDYLLGVPLEDYDFTTDALPQDIAAFLPVNMTFARYGSVHYITEGIKVDITTLRVESGYSDYRHPSEIKFVKDIYLDYKRRDFTINAIYIDSNYDIIDPTERGLADLKARRLVFIGDPRVRIEEDPLRILRAQRFMKKYGLSADEETLKALTEGRSLLDKLSKAKILEEKRKAGE
jgi:tRNA nucleotidyltransferase (CCA-adding enzyme)